MLGKMSSEEHKDVSVAVIGGGLVGALQACVMAKKGYREVHLYEVRWRHNSNINSAANKLLCIIS